MNRGFFITGTDTGIGKTCVSLGLMQALRAQGHSVLGMKPVASGCIASPLGLRNEDAQYLQSLNSKAISYDEVNPYALQPAIAPHLAAEEAGIRIEPEVIEAAFRKLAAQGEWVVVEGVGGWMVPVNSAQTMADVVALLDIPVILVVGIRLGCLNHALLTAWAIRARGARLAGWVANRIDADCECQDENVQALRERLDAPLIADFPYMANPRSTDARFSHIDLGALLIN